MLSNYFKNIFYIWIPSKISSQLSKNTSIFAMYNAIWIKIIISNIIWLSLVLFTMQRLHRMADEDWLTSTNKNNNKWIQLGCKHITIHKYMYNHTISAKVIHLLWIRMFYPYVCTECTNQAWAMALNLYKNIFLQSKKKIFSQPTYLYMLEKSKRVCNEIVVSLKII